MKNTRLLLPLLIVLLNSGCATYGPAFVIVTPVPAEDFLVVCEWHDRTWLSGGHGGKQRVNYKVKVVSSNEKVDCGISFSGGDGSVDITHPIYMGVGITSKTTADESDQLELVDGVLHIKLSKTKLDVLDELKARFEAGEWANQNNPRSAYLSKLPACGAFPYQYLDYYSEVKRVSREYFKRKYHELLYACALKEYSEIEKYDPYSAKQLPNADTRMKSIWDPAKWRKYE